jgi:four helix bundle protein
MRDHRDLVVWDRGMQLTVDVYATTSNFPASERFGLTQQIRRSAVSVVSNIAEGAARGSTRNFIAFLHIARGSLAELETQLLLAERIGFPLKMAYFAPRLEEMRKLLNGLLRGLSKRVQHMPK